MLLYCDINLVSVIIGQLSTYLPIFSVLHLRREFLEREISIPEDRLVDISRRLTDMLNRQLLFTRDIFLLTNFGASVKVSFVTVLRFYLFIFCETGN